jgi:hypothetical protein
MNKCTLILSLFFIGTILITQPASCQKQIDMDRVMQENPDLYKGTFTRLGVGFSRSSFNYGEVFKGIVLNPLHFNIDFGKRINRKYGAYFTISGDVLLKEVQEGFDWINQWAQAGMYLGGIFYILGGNSYVAPEVGLGIFNFEYTEYQVTGSFDVYSLGIGSMLKYGYERHLAGKVFLGVQAYLSYAYTWETDTADAIEPPTATSFTYGAAINFKFGK